MKKDLTILGIVSILSVILLVGTYKVSIEGFAIESMEVNLGDWADIVQYASDSGYAIRGALDEAGPMSTAEPPKVESPRTVGQGISAELLEPSYMEFNFNRIPIPETQEYNFFPRQKDDIHTYSGRFGYYDFDPTNDINIKLCTFPYKVSKSVIACENVELNYDPEEGTVFWARGYQYDEFIGRQALRDYGVIYYVVSKDEGIIAQSNTGLIKIVN